MKKRILILILSTFSCSFALCQTKKNMISFSAGPSLPISNFGSSSFSNENAGFAKLGENLNFSFQHRINNSFSISAMLYGQRNPINTKTFESEFSGRTFIYGINTFYPVKFPNWSFKKDKWLSSGFLVGGSNEFPLSKGKHDLFIDFKAMIGLAYSTSPHLYGSSKTDTTLATQTMTKKSAIGINYLFGSGLKYNLTDKYSLLFNFQYLVAGELKFKNVTQTFRGEINPQAYNNVSWGNSYTANSTQSLSSLNFNIGMGVRF